MPEPTTAPAVEDNLDGLEAFYAPIGREQQIERERAARRSEGVPPEFRPEPAQPGQPRQSRITDPTVRAAIDQLPERVRPIAEAEYELLQRRGGDGTATATAQRDLTLARGEREAREAFATQQRAELERVRARRVELPDFVPTQENAMSLGTLFGLVGVAGTLMGGKGQQSAIGAMNAMSGMMAGWRQGRTDLYNRERQKYEQEMKRVQEQNAVLQRDFQDALNVMKTDLDAGLARAREAAARHGVQIAGAAAARQGAAGVQNFLQGLRSSMMQIEATQARQTSQAPIPRMVRDPDGQVRFYAANRGTGDLIRDSNGQLVEMAPPRGRGGAMEDRISEITRRYNNRMAGGINELAGSLQIIGRLPETARPLPFARYLESRDASLRRDLLENFRGRVADVENQLFTSLTADTTRLAAVLQAGGVPSGMTEAAINEMRGIIPRNGQPRIMVYTFLALLKRQGELALDTLRASGGNAEQIALAEDGVMRLREAVPYDIEHLVDIVRGGRRSIAETGRVIQEAPANEETKRIVERGVQINERLTAIRNRYNATPGSRGVATEADIMATMRANNMSREDTINSLVRMGYTIEAQP